MEYISIVPNMPVWFLRKCQEIKENENLDHVFICCFGLPKVEDRINFLSVKPLFGG